MKVLDSANQDPQAPKIEFPCENYVIKILGENHSDFKQSVVQAVKKLAPDLDESRVKENKSAKGTFTSVSVYICAQDEQHLKDIHAELKLDVRVKMVL